MWHQVAWLLGLTNASGPWYLWWSGIAGDLPELAAIVIVWRKVNCHAKGCWRIGLHHVQGSHFTVCRMHHPDHEGRKPYTTDQIAHHARKDRQPNA